MDTLREILSDANKDINTIMKHAGNAYFRNFMEAAYIKEKRLPLPDDPVPYTVPTIESEVQTKGIMWQFLKKLDTLRNPKLHPMKREMMFIDALENVTAEEAIVLIHMKNQSLPSIYGNILLKDLYRVGYFK